MRQLLILTILLTAATHGYAQFHYKGLKGTFVEVGIQTNFDKLYGIGYQSFLNRRFQAEISAEYESGQYQDQTQYLYYDVDASYQIENFYLNETLNYNFLTVFKRIFLNVGVGLTQGYQRIVVTDSLTYVVNEERLKETDETEEFQENQVLLKDKLRLGGNVNALVEFYINRYITLTVRHRFKLFLNSHYDNPIQHSSLGLRINF